MFDMGMAAFSSIWQERDGGLRTDLRAWTPAIKISAELFRRFQVLIFETAGIWLRTGQQELLSERLEERRRVIGARDLQAYFATVSHPSQGDERERLIEALTRGANRFFRCPRHFEFLAQRLFPRWGSEAALQRRARRLRVWSAGCGGAEEPFSLAMLLRSHFPAAAGWDLQVLATDVSMSALSRATSPSWPSVRAVEIPQDLLEEFVVKAGARLRFAPEISDLVRISRLNLLARAYPIQGTVDLIFCRDVLSFFDVETQARIVRQLAGHLSPSGFLIIGERERLPEPSGIAQLAPSIHGRADAQGRLLQDFRAASAPDRDWR